MKIVCVYREASEVAREVDGWLREFERRTGATIERMSPDGPDGQSFCRLYGIVEYPTIIAVSDEGRMLEMWRGMPLPLIDHVSRYAPASGGAAAGAGE